MAMIPNRSANRSLIAACLALTAAIAAAAEPAAGDVARLIAQLGDPSWAERQKAEDDLVAQGPAALPDLTAALPRETDLDVRDRLQSAITRIGREQQLTPTLVTVDRTFDSPAEAFTFLADLLKIEVRNEAKPDASAEAEAVTLRLENRPWLEALDEVIASSAFDARVDDERLTIINKASGATKPPTFYAGAVAVQAINVKHVQRINFTNDIGNDQQTMQLAIRCEPKARLRGTGNNIYVKQCLADDGKSIINPRARRFPVIRQSVTAFACTLAPHGEKDAPPALKLLEGELTGELITEMRETKLDDLTNLPQAIQLGGVNATVRALEKNNRQWKLVVDFATADPAAINGGDLTPEEALRVTDDAGALMRVAVTNPTRTADSIQQTYTLTSKDFASDAKPARLAWTTIGKTRRVIIPFRFKDLPMPK